MQIECRARSKAQEINTYVSAETYALEVEKEVVGGTGTANKPYVMKVKVTNNGTEDFEGIIQFLLFFKKNNPRFLLPAFMYGRNRGESPKNVPNEFPRLREGMDRPASPWWMVRSDRLSHPVAMVFDSGKIYGLSASPYFVKIDGEKKAWLPQLQGDFYQYAGYTCSLEEGSIGYTLGYENAPWFFLQSHNVYERSPLGENCFILNSGETISSEMYLYDYEAENELGCHDLIREIYYKYHEAPRKASSVEIAVKDLSEAVSDYAWLKDEKCYSGFVFETAQEGVYTYNKLGSLSWTNGLSVAVPQLVAGLRTKNQSVRCQALECIENIISHCMNPKSGLPFDAYSDGKWSIKGWWFDGMHTPGHSAYLTGQAVYYILKAYEYEKKIEGVSHGEWLDFVKPILEHVEKTKNTDDEYPFIFSETTGAGIEYESLGSSWCLAAQAYYSWLVGDKKYLEGLARSEQHYYDTYVKQLQGYGAPLDTDKAIDSEGILAYIRAVHYLHAITQEDKYLEHMRAAIDYEFTFKFCYNSPIKVPPLSKIGWSSCGGSVTSTANPHIHPMSSTIVDELLYYYEQTKDEYMKARMEDVIGWGCQTYNTHDKEYDYGKKGWMSERFCHSQGLLTQKYSDGSVASTWFALMPWASCSIVEGFVGEYWEHYIK